VAKIFSGPKKPIPKTFGLLLLISLLSGCACFKSRDSMLKDCEATQAKMRAELKEKNLRLEKFNQINQDGTLKGPAAKGQ
jgi:hypothetical protein